MASSRGTQRTPLFSSGLTRSGSSGEATAR